MIVRCGNTEIVLVPETAQDRVYLVSIGGGVIRLPTRPGYGTIDESISVRVSLVYDSFGDLVGMKIAGA